MGKFLLSLVGLLTLGVATASAKDAEKSYNLERAIELFAEENYADAVSYLKKEVSDNPNSYEAYELLGWYYGKTEENGEALNAINLALKYYPKKEKAHRAYGHYVRGKVYAQLCDTAQAIADYQQAIKLAPEKDEYLYDLADIYFDLKRYSDADDIYDEIIKNLPGSASPYFGKARNAYNQERFDEAREYVAKARRLSPNDDMCDRMEMRIYLKENNHKEALEKSLTLLANDLYDFEAYNTMLVVSDSIYVPTINALTKRAFEDKANKWEWSTLIGMVQKNHKDFQAATKTFKSISEEDTEMRAWALNNLLDCYEEIDDMAQLEATADSYLELYPDDPPTLIRRADSRFFTGRYQEAEADYRKAMEEEPKYGSFCHYRLGWSEEMQQNFDNALQHYDMALILDDTNAYIYMMKGFLLKDHLNRPDEAKEAFMQCIAHDTIAEEGCSLQFAYVGLGQRDKAVEVMDSIIALNPNNAGNYYDATCIYSRLHEKDNALKHLRLALEKGYIKFRHIENDDDMDFIRDTPEFKALMEKYDKPTECKETTEKEEETVVYEIPLVRQPGGTYLVKAAINELAMDFILDTGCSDVSLSQVESDFMLKNGYLKQSDMLGNQRYTDANGYTHTSRTVNLSKVKIGDLEVNDIRAGIVPNQKAPLLLGQQVLNRFGKVEIDSKTNTLRITVRK